jgi:uncharacterized protein YciI
LDCPAVTDAELKRLQEFTGLGMLSVRGPQVADEGVRMVRKALPNCWVC